MHDGRLMRAPTAGAAVRRGSRCARRATAIAALGVLALPLAGCSTLLNLTERLAIGFSLLRLPVTMQTPEANTCMEPGQLTSLVGVAEAVAAGASRRRAVEEHFVPEVADPVCRRVLLRHPRFDRIDDHADVIEAETIVIVAISGGGARSARLGAHTLAQLEERYNAHVAERGERPLAPLGCTIGAFSTVSGGSIYVSYVAARFADGSENIGEGCRDPSRAKHVRNVFQGVRDDLLPRAGQRHLGTVGGVAYFSPFFFFLLPVMTLTTDRSFLDVLSHGVNATQKHYFSEIMLGELPQRPRFFFNAVALETGAPFVLTQRIQQLPSDYRPVWTARIDMPQDSVRNRARALSSSLGLEDLNSSPALFPLTYAAMASASFPPVMEPLELRRYGLDEAAEKMYATEHKLHLTDGGVFDNSGLITAVDFFEHAVYEAQRQNPGRLLERRLVLLSINADTSRAVGHLRGVELRGENVWGADVDWPFRHLGAAAIDQIHFSNKRRGEEAAWTRLTELQRSMRPGVEIELVYLPVNLAQLSEFDPYAIEGGEQMFQDVSRIPTDYVIRVRDDELLAAAVEKILEADQSRGSRHREAGWPVGPDGEMIYQLGEAFVQAVVQAQATPRNPPREFPPSDSPPDL